jgi:hypothetical protein
MKKRMDSRALSALAALVVTLTGCVKGKTMAPPEPCTPIRFGVSTQWENGDKTRTEYSGRDENAQIVSSGSDYERIDWVEGRDKIRVVCEAADGGTVLSGMGEDYSLGAPTENGRYSQADITPDEGDGLLWGSGDHYFYAFYPAPGTESNYPFRQNNPVQPENAVIAASNHTATVTGVIPSVQEALLDSGTSTYKPNMNYAYMYAQKKVDAHAPASPISLSFQPLVTTLEFTLKNSGAFPVTKKLTRIELYSASTPLTGMFSALLAPDATPVIATVGTTGNSIMMTLPDGGCTLSGTTPVRFTFLTVPMDQTELTLVLSFGADYSFKHKLDLKDTSWITPENPEGWISVKACKKAYISNLSVPGDLWIYTLDATGPTTSVPMTGGNTNYTVSSYRTNTDDPDFKKPVGWTAQYSVDGGDWTDEKPSWLTNFTANGPGSTASPWEQKSATLSANNTPMQWEGSLTPVSTERTNARDLSCYDIYGNFTGGVEGTVPYNTANCYVVGAPGWYRIPCVYGNAIKNAMDNPSSYTGPDSGEHLLTGGFPNHADVPVTSPWIKDNKSAAGADSPSIILDEAALVWQDHAGLIEEVAYDSDYLYFKVSETGIFQGNALLAVKAGGTTVWSWHIWVMDKPEERFSVTDVYSHPTVNHSVVDPVPMLSLPLGFCDSSSGSAKSRSVRVKFIQEISGYERVIAINQLGGQSFNVTYYQWGRKDPMPPGVVNLSTAEANSSKDKPLFDIQGSPIRKPGTIGEEITVGESIQEPEKMANARVTPSGRWTLRYDNLWNANIVTEETDPSGSDILVCKTIYDPCPPGFKVPNRNAYSGFTYSGDNLDNAPAPLVSPQAPVEDFDAFDTVLGYNFYVDQQDPSKGTVFFHRTGSRIGNGNISGVGKWADYTTAAPNNRSDGNVIMYFTFSKTYIRPLFYNLASWAFPVRPIAED